VIMVPDQFGTTTVVPFDRVVTAPVALPWYGHCDPFPDPGDGAMGGNPFVWTTLGHCPGRCAAGSCAEGIRAAGAVGSSAVRS